MAAGRPGLITHVGLHTFVDPRYEGGKLNSVTHEDLVELITIHGREWLLYHPFPIDVAFIRGTTIDEEGNLSIEEEGARLEVLAVAQATHNAGGKVIAQAKRLAVAGSLPAQQVVVPGFLIDAIVIHPGQWQTVEGEYNPAFSGQVKVPLHRVEPLPLTERKVVARRAFQETLRRGHREPGRGDGRWRGRGRRRRRFYRPDHPDGRAGRHRRHPGQRSRLRRLPQPHRLRRPALPVRLLRRWRARRLLSRLRRDRRHGQCQRQQVWRQADRHRRICQHLTERQEGRLLFDIHRRWPRSRGRRGPAPRAKAGIASSATRSSRSPSTRNIALGVARRSSTSPSEPSSRPRPRDCSLRRLPQASICKETSWSNAHLAHSCGLGDRRSWTSVSSAPRPWQHPSTSASSRGGLDPHA